MTAYLFGALLFMIYWFAAYAWLRDFRRPMLAMSFLYGVIGVVFGFVYTADWWQPETITGTRVGIEDFLLGFSNGGVGFALPYLIAFRGWTPKALGVQPLKAEASEVLIFFSITASATLILFYGFGFSSFYSNALGLIVSLLYVYYRRRDLILVSFLSGFAMLILSLPVYALTVLFFPGWVERTWMIDKLSGLMFIGVPIEDFIWYFLVGAAISVIYPLFSGDKNFHFHYRP